MSVPAEAGSLFGVPLSLVWQFRHFQYCGGVPRSPRGAGAGLGASERWPKVSAFHWETRSGQREEWPWVATVTRGLGKGTKPKPQAGMITGPCREKNAKPEKGGCWKSCYASILHLGGAFFFTLVRKQWLWVERRRCPVLAETCAGCGESG